MDNVIEMFSNIKAYTATVYYADAHQEAAADGVNHVPCAHAVDVMTTPTQQRVTVLVHCPLEVDRSRDSHQGGQQGGGGADTAGGGADADGVHAAVEGGAGVVQGDI